MRRSARVGRILRLGLIPLFAALLVAAYTPSWKNTPVPQWSEDDAKALLTDSPWVKQVKLDQVRNLSKAERVSGGDWEAGIGPSVGLAGTGIFGTWRETEAMERAHARPDLGKVEVRWESAFPVRAAESKINEAGVPTWQGDYYAIAVYALPRPYRFNVAGVLKDIAFLKREKRKDLKPSRVVVVPRPDGLETFVYLFPRSIEITKKERSLAFVAQIGRLFVYLNFFPEDMQLQGELQL
jgi:hypothetical protein